MSADQLVQLVTQVLFVLVFLFACRHAIRTPRRATLDTALLFGVASVLVTETWVTEALGGTPGRYLVDFSSACIMALPYLLLRLVQDFVDVPRLLDAAAGIGLLLSVLCLFLFPLPYPGVLTSLLVLYFAGLTGYVAIAVVRTARRATGVTRRRVQAVAVGSLALGLTILTAGLQVGFPAELQWWTIVGRIMALICGMAFFVGFAPPAWLRRSWQEPEVRRFLGRVTALPRLPDMQSVVRELEQGAAAAFGTAEASIGMWDAATQLLRFYVRDAEILRRPDELIAGQAFATQRPIYSSNVFRDNPVNAASYQAYGTSTLVTAPVTAGENRLGVLVIYATRSSIFVDDDLVLVRLLADQAAVILESHALFEEAARVRAREEATRLKDEFLSAAAHDLRTPLTTMLGQAQLMERRARRNPAAPSDLPGILRIVQETQRLKRLVLSLLDVARVEDGKLVTSRERVDLVPLAESARARYASERHRCRVEASGPVIGMFDTVRMMQLIDNLLDNAVKYMPEGGEVTVRIWTEGQEVCLAVADEGIGIAPADLTRLFERFHRGVNVNAQDATGLGLGLYICRGIVVQHGGRIWATSPGVGQGSVFHVALPQSEPALEVAAPLPESVASVDAR